MLNEVRQDLDQIVTRAAGKFVAIIWIVLHRVHLFGVTKERVRDLRTV